MIGTSSRTDKLDKAKELGLDVGIDYTTQDVVEEVLRHTDGNGVDVVYEHVGGTLFQQGLDSLKKDGRLVTCGAHSGEVVDFDIIPFFRRQLSVIGSFVYDRNELETVFGLIARGLSNDQICDELVLSEATVKTHVNRILAKLGGLSRVQLVVLAYESGFVRPGA